jgi:hypothetical protein
MPPRTTRWRKRDCARRAARYGALCSEPIAAQAGIEALPEEYRAADGTAELTIDGDPGRLAGPVGEAVLRVVQEALTNVRKHAPGRVTRSGSWWPTIRRWCAKD